MAFQAGGPHAQDRGAGGGRRTRYAEQTRVPATARWEKPQGKRRRRWGWTKTFTVGAARRRAWSSAATRSRPGTRYPGLFASLATGNPVIVKPHPARRPAAGDHRVDRPRGAGRGRLLPDLVTLAAEEPGGERWPPTLAVRPEVRIVDFTGSTAFGDVAGGARPAGAGLHREGRRQHDRHRLDRRLRRACWRNLAFSLCLYSGQMCTTPQNLLRPARRHRDRRGAQVGRGVRGRPRAPRWRSCSATTPRRSSCSARSSTTACCRVWTVRVRWATWWSSPGR